MKLSSYAFNNYGHDAKLYNGIHDLERELESKKAVIGQCPHCHHALTDAELRRLWAQRNAAKQTPHAGPGRPRGSKNKTTRKHPEPK